MNKVWVLVGAVSIFVIVLFCWIFIVDFGGFSQLLGEKSQEAVQDESSRFIGTWSMAGAASLNFFADGSYRQGVTEGAWSVAVGVLTLSPDDGPSVVRYQYLFSEHETVLELTNQATGETTLLNRQ